MVATALRALDRGIPAVVDGRVNRLVSYGPRLLPRRIVIGVASAPSDLALPAIRPLLIFVATSSAARPDLRSLRASRPSL